MIFTHPLDDLLEFLFSDTTNRPEDHWSPFKLKNVQYLRLFFSAKALASSVGTARRCRRSDLFPTLTNTISGNLEILTHDLKSVYFLIPPPAKNFNISSYFQPKVLFLDNF